MKRTFLVLLLAITGLGLQAQKLEKAKSYLEKKKYTEAKTEIDGVVQSDKYKNNSDAWYTRAKIYLDISKDSSLNASVADARGTALQSLEEYLKLEDENVKDEGKRLLQLKLENNAPLIDLYSAYSHDAASYFNGGNYKDAITNFQKCLDVFDILAGRKLITMEYDTTSHLYAGVAAEKAKDPDLAAKYYSSIADRKIKSEGFIDIYKWLANHYMQKDSIAQAQKYLHIGEELYPQDDFWATYELDMLRDKGTKDQLYQKYEDIIAKDPNNYLMMYNYAVELYQDGYKSNQAERPANSAELITKATALLKKITEVKPDFANTYMVLGQIAYNHGVDIDNKNKAIRPPQGGKLSAAQLKEKDDLRTQMLDSFNLAIPYFIKVDDLLDKEGKLKPEQKDVLRNSLDLLLVIYETKRGILEQRRNKADASKDKAASADLEKQLKELEASNATYTDKYNDIDKKH